jgi:hypothetical protein
MLCFLSVRRLKPDSYDAFRQAWEPESGAPPEIVRIYHVRSVNDPDVVTSFGLANMTSSDLDGFRERLSAEENDRQRLMQEHVDELIVDDVFEVVEEIEPARA